MYNNITGIILSGGISSRIGKNKSLLKNGDQTLIEQVMDLMKNLFKNVILVTNEPGLFEFTHIQIYEDVFKYKGPLAGIHSGLINSSTEKNFFISCDLPFINSTLIKFLVDYKTDKLITVGKANGKIQHLAGLYSKKCLETAEQLLSDYTIKNPSSESRGKNNASVLSLLDIIEAEILSVDKQAFYNEDLFFNMNTMEDYEYVISKLSTSD